LPLAFGDPGEERSERHGDQCRRRLDSAPISQAHAMARAAAKRVAMTGTPHQHRPGEFNRGSSLSARLQGIRLSARESGNELGEAVLS